MAEWSNNAEQEINPGESVIFTENPVPCNRGLVRHRDGTGNFLLAGVTNGCACVKSANYLVDFGANIAIPTGGTVGEISLAITIDGATIPSSQMIVTPAAVEEYFNVTSTAIITVPRGCCFNVSLRNVPASEDPTVTPAPVINLQNGNLIINRIA